jgi:phytanoyl-CoA hydroxylase
LLTTDRIEQFREQGYLRVEPFLGGTELDHITECFMATVERLQSEHALENVQSGGDSDDEFQVYQIRTAHLQHPVFRMLIHHSRLLDIVESLIGPDIRLVHYQGVYKPANTGGAVGWHQDNHYFEVQGERTVSVWMALDDATEENGCMWYIPGGHRRRYPHEQLWDVREKKGFYFAIPDSEIDDSGATPIPVERGGLSIHHCLMPHRSLKNRTDVPRRGLAMHFMDAKAPDPGFLKRNLLPGATPMLRGVATTQA